MKSHFFRILNKIGMFFLISLVCSGFASAATMHSYNSVVGDWQILNAKGQPSSLISIRKQGHVYNGKVSKIYLVDGAKETDRCVACHGPQHNKQILGLTIISNMICKGRKCRGGRILDPTDGKVYKATLRLANYGYRLKVRGYIGISLFGKTVVWNRFVSKKS